MERETKSNILRGVIVASYLDNEAKKELSGFVNELEEKESEE